MSRWDELFTKSYLDKAYADRCAPLSPQVIENITVDEMRDLYNRYYSNFNGSVFIINSEYSPSYLKPLLEKYLAEKRKKEESRKPFIIKTTYLLPDNYKPFPGNKSIVQPFSLPDQYPGRDNETDFIKYLDSKYEKIEWWFKNGDSGKDYLAFKYTDTQTGKERLFYPDWIVKFKDKRIGIFDTKGGITAKSIETKDKAEELQRRIKTLNATSRRFKYVGGIVEKREMKWVYNDGVDYVYEKDDDWKEMEEVF
jgi:type III restriction enzyme